MYIGIKIMDTGHLWLIPVILTTKEAKIRRIMVRSQLGQIVHETLSRKLPNQKKVGGLAQVVELLPSKYEALNSNPNTAKRNKTWKVKRHRTKHYH
jgi:hypothetical protein